MNEMIELQKQEEEDRIWREYLEFKIQYDMEKEYLNGKFNETEDNF